MLAEPKKPETAAAESTAPVLLPRRFAHDERSGGDGWRDAGGKVSDWLA